MDRRNIVSFPRICLGESLIRGPELGSDCIDHEAEET